MREIDEEVTRILKVQPDGEAALALWKKVWASYQSNGIEGAGECLDGLVRAPREAGEEF